MTKATTKTNTKPASSIRNCRVLEIGLEDLAECLKPGPSTCSYSMPFGYCFLCKHPRLNDIIANTKKAQLSGEMPR